MAIYQGYRSELLKSQRVYLPNDIILEFDDNKPNKVRMKTGKLHKFDIYRRLPYVSGFCECHDYGKGFVINVGNDKDKEFIVEHNLDSDHIIYQIYDNETNMMNETDVSFIDKNSIKVKFNNIPKKDQYKVLVYSTRYYTDPYIGNEDDLNYEIDHGIGQSDILLSVLNTESNNYEHVQIKNVDSSDDKVEIIFKDKIKNNQYLVSMEAGNYSQTITLNKDSSNKTFTINHNLDCDNIIVQVYNLTSRRKVYSEAQIKVIDNSNVEVSFREFEPEDFKDRCRMRIVLLDVRDVECCYQIEKNKIHTVKQVKSKIPVIVDWKSNTNYIIGELVRYDNKIYKCTTNNANSRFNLDCWEEVDVDNLTAIMVPEWNSGTNYIIGELVRHDDKIYECIKNNINSTFSLDYWIEADEKDLDIKEID